MPEQGCSDVDRASVVDEISREQSRKSCGVKQAVRKPGWRSASSSQRRRGMFTTVAGEMTSWFVPILHWKLLDRGSKVADQVPGEVVQRRVIQLGPAALQNT